VVAALCSRCVLWSLGQTAARERQPSLVVTPPPALSGCDLPNFFTRRRRRRLGRKGAGSPPTCTCVHTPPRAVRTLRSLSFAAMALWLVAPARTISSIIGRTLAANRLAFAFKAALPSLAASAIPGLPRRCPRFLAACSAALVRSEIISPWFAGSPPRFAFTPRPICPATGECVSHRRLRTKAIRARTDALGEICARDRGSGTFRWNSAHCDTCACHC
jgi:hypothetical protein